MKTLALSLLFVTSAWSAFAGTVLEDKFDGPKHPQRQLPVRGIWKIENGIATCTQDDEVYKKFKDHGPIIMYNVAFTDATIKGAFKAHGTQNFVFTLNNVKGHVFRFLVGKTGLSVRAWPEGSHDAVALLNPKPGTPAIKDDEWVAFEAKVEGKHCTVKLNDFVQKFEHEGIGRTKSALSLGFSFGTVSIKEVSVTTP